MRFMGRLREGFYRPLAGAEEGNDLVAAAPAVPVWEVFRRFWPHARPHRRWLPVILLFVALGPAIDLAMTWMYKVLVDGVLVPGNFGLLGWVILAYVGLTLADGIIGFFDQYLS